MLLLRRRCCVLPTIWIRTTTARRRRTTRSICRMKPRSTVPRRRPIVVVVPVPSRWPRSRRRPVYVRVTSRAPPPPGRFPGGWLHRSHNQRHQHHHLCYFPITRLMKNYCNGPSCPITRNPITTTRSRHLLYLSITWWIQRKQQLHPRPP